MRSSHFYIVVCAACIFFLALHAYAIDNSKVLEKLKEHDSIYESGLTVLATLQSKDEISHRLGLFLDVKRRWRLTFGGDRVGYVMEVIDYEKPKYELYQQLLQTEQLKEPNQDSQFDRQSKSQTTDTNEPLAVPIRTRQWGYWGNDLSGNHYEDTVLTLAPGGKVTETGKMHNSSVFGPRDDGPLGPKWTFFWSLGRFFSKQIDRITSVEETSAGRILVVASGKKGKNQNGRWELEIEPAAAWMVRKARFNWDINPNLINVEMRNEGTAWSGSYCIPKEAVINAWGSIKGRETERLTFEPKVEKFDEQLYSDAQKAVAENKTPTLTIHDYRVSPPVISEPNRAK
jgi:hypothetical protein